MQERVNSLKAAIQAGRAHIGIWCSLASALTTEIVAGSGAGWVLIDGEHSPNDLRSIMAQLQVMGGFDSEAVVRLPSDDPNLIKQALDIGLMGGARHTMRIFPHSLARRMILTGYRLPAEEAYRRGIIEACVPLDQLMEEAMKIARSIASKSPKALSLAKRAINTVETMPLRDGYRFEQNLTVEMTRHEDSKEAMRAFLEKRPAVFKDEA